MTNQEFNNSDVLEETKEVAQESKVLTNNELQLIEKSKSLLANVTPEEKEAILKLVDTLDGHDELSIKSYGLPVQQKLSANSEAITNKTKINNTDDAGLLLNELMFELDNSSEKHNNKPKFLQKFFKRVDKTKFEIESNFQTVEGRVNEIVDKLNKENEVLERDIVLIGELAENNNQISVATDIYIKAGNLKIEELKVVTIPELSEDFSKNPSPTSEQALMDATNYLNRLEKRVMDLMLTQQILRQSSPQLNLMKNSSYTLSEKIQSSINNAIPTWKNQISIGIALRNQKNVLTAEQAVTNTTNSLIRNNADKLKQNITEIAKANERGIVDIETLEYAQNQLIETIRETVEIQKQGRTDRESAKIKLENMDAEMREKLMEIAQDAGMDYATGTTSPTRKTVYDSTEKIDYKDMI